MKITCGTCNGAKGQWRKVQSYERCRRCKGRGETKTGRVTVPCSGCDGAGGWTRTTDTVEDCRTCRGKGYIKG